MIEYGVHIYKHPTENIKQMDMVKALGIKWVRIELSWRSKEPSKGAFNWVASDELINAARAKGLEVIVLLSHPPAWALPPSTTPPHFADYVAAVINRYHPKIIENFPEWKTFVAGATASEMVEIYRAGYNRAKALDPSVIFLGIWGYSDLPDWGDIVEIIQAGLMDVCDGFGVHQYIQSGRISQHGSVKAVLDWSLDLYARALREADLPEPYINAKPIYWLEFGFDCYGTFDPVGEEEAARRLVQQLEWFNEHPELPIKLANYFVFWSDNPSLNLVSSDLVPYQTYYAYQSFIPTPTPPISPLLPNLRSLLEGGFPRATQIYSLVDEIRVKRQE